MSAVFSVNTNNGFVSNRPEDNVDAILAWMIQNFERNYNDTRAPFGVYLHAAWFEKGKSYFEAYTK